MSTALELVYQYRQLLAKCESAAGLSLDEIELFSTLEQLIDSAQPRPIPAQLRTRRYADAVSTAVLGREGLICTGCDHVDSGQLVEVRFDDSELALSYRFAARVDWIREREDTTCDVGLRWEGTPLLVRKNPLALQHELDVTEAA